VIGAVGAILSVFFLFLPWYSMVLCGAVTGPSLSSCAPSAFVVNGFAMRTNLVALLAVLTLCYYIALFLMKTPSPGGLQAPMIAVVLGAALVLLTLIDIAVVPRTDLLLASSLGSLGSSSVRVEFSVSYGWILELLASLAVLGGALLTRFMPAAKLSLNVPTAAPPPPTPPPPIAQ
jgi:hypothetical protein